MTVEITLGRLIGVFLFFVPYVLGLRLAYEEGEGWSLSLLIPTAAYAYAGLAFFLLSGGLEQ